MSDLNSAALEVVSPPMPKSRTAATTTSLFWTDDAMRQAKPLPLPHGDEPPPEQVRLALAEPTAPPVRVAPKPPVGKSLTIAEPSEPGTTLVEQLTAYPYAVTGKLYMRFPNGAMAVGSAWVIGRRSIFTAGHCLFDANSGGWATNVLFQPQYRNGQSAGKWVVTLPAALREWVTRGDLRFDMACGVVNKVIGDKTGQAGYGANDPSAAGLITAVGYPAERTRRHPFNGEQMWQSVGRYDPTRDPAAGTTADRIVGMFNDLSGGCSGGPWFRPGDSGPVACGLNSHVRITPADVPPRMYSPYFGAGFLRLVKWLADNRGEPNMG
jgi:V8-like Glu-specific endopeptidase